MAGRRCKMIPDGLVQDCGNSSVLGMQWSYCFLALVLSHQYYGQVIIFNRKLEYNYISMCLSLINCVSKRGLFNMMTLSSQYRNSLCQDCLVFLMEIQFTWKESLYWNEPLILSCHFHFSHDLRPLSSIRLPRTVWVVSGTICSWCVTQCNCWCCTWLK